jgi:hypothetical protein
MITQNVTVQPTSVTSDFQTNNMTAPIASSTSDVMLTQNVTVLPTTLSPQNMITSISHQILQIFLKSF